MENNSISQINFNFGSNKFIQLNHTAENGILTCPILRMTPELTFTFITRLPKQDGGSWKRKDDKIGINVDTLNRSKEWKNVEIT